jgi:hypothetical protein
MQRKALERSVRIAGAVLALAVVSGVWYGAVAAGREGTDAVSARIVGEQAVAETARSETAVLWARLSAIGARLRALVHRG